MSVYDREKFQPPERQVMLAAGAASSGRVEPGRPLSAGHRNWKRKYWERKTIGRELQQLLLSGSKTLQGVYGE
jgi:hypothetical protein